MADVLAPQYQIQVADQDLSSELQRFVRKVEYESADGLADMAKLELSNPDFVFSDSKIFQPGNPINIWFGYGSLEFVGRVEITTVRCDFPEADMPRAEIIGYTRDHAMMDEAPLEGSPRVFEGTPVTAILENLAEWYGFRFDIDEPDRTITGIQKAGMSDYDLVKGLANLTGFLFWVDGDEQGNWTLHFADPSRVGTSRLQEKQYTFHYANDEFSTLMSFEPEYAVRDSRTKIKIAIRDPARGENFIEIVEEEQKAPDIKSKGKAGDTQKLEGPIPSGATIKLFFGEHSVEIVTDKTFLNSKDARLWAQQWFRRKRENFIVGSGNLIGVESLRARQVHALSGIGNAFNGEYYFVRARHMLDAGSGYTIDFTARKHV